MSETNVLSEVNVNGVSFQLIKCKRNCKVLINGNIKRVCKSESAAMLNFRQEIDKEIVNQWWNNE